MSRSRFAPARKAHPAFCSMTVEELDVDSPRVSRAPASRSPGTTTFPAHRRFHTADGHGNRVELLAGL